MPAGQVLSRPSGATIPKKRRANLLLSLDKLMNGEMQPGELYQLVLGITRPVAPGQQTTRPERTLCLDCGGELVQDQIGPLSSQPRRCRTCGKLKRRQHNSIQKARLGGSI